MWANVRNCHGSRLKVNSVMIEVLRLLIRWDGYDANKHHSPVDRERNRERKKPQPMNI